jgi:curved DNA-binding protein CbpA
VAASPAGAQAHARPPVAPQKAGAPAKANPLGADGLAELHERTSKLAQLDYYEVLRVARDAPLADIKKAFYQESRTYHPDRFFQLTDLVLKERVNELYKRVTEAYSVLRDEQKRKRYTQEVSGPLRAQKLRFTELSESEAKQEQKREQEERIGTHPKGRQLYQTAAADLAAQRWSQAERNLKMALTYEPSNTLYKEKLALAQQKLNEGRPEGQSFKIK